MIYCSPMHVTMKRLYQEAEKLGITGQTELAKKLNQSPQTINNWEARGISKSGMILIQEILRIDASYLSSGTITNNLPLNSYSVDASKLAAVPVVGKSMGGLPDTLFTDEGRFIDGHDEYAEVYSGDQNAFVVRVDGNSMFPKYRQGDYALVEPNTTPELEDDVIVKLMSGEVMIKRLLSRRSGVVLGSYNDTVTYTYKDDEILWMYYVAYPVPARKIKSRI